MAVRMEMVSLSDVGQDKQNPQATRSRVARRRLGLTEVLFIF